MSQTFAIGIGGAAGQGVATPGDIFAKIFSRRGLHLNAYNAYQSIIRGGHTFLTIRTGPDKVTNMGDRIDLLIPLNQDTMDRHLRTAFRWRGLYLQRGFHQARIGRPTEYSFVRCPSPSWQTSSRNKVAQNTLAIGAALSMMGIGFEALESVLREQFRKKEEAVIDGKHRHRACRLRLRHPELQAVCMAAADDGQQVCRPERQCCHGNGRCGGRRANSIAPIP